MMTANKMKSWFSLFLFLVGAGSLQAQEEVKPERWALQLTVQHSDILFQEAFNIGQLGVADEVNIRPVYSVEGQYFLTKGPKRKLFLSAETGYYANLYHDRWFVGTIGLGLERRFFQKLILSSRLELGRSIISSRDPQYVLENEIWVPTNSNRSIFFATSFSPRVDLGYRILTVPYPVDLIANYQVSLVGHPEFGLLPYYSTGIGVRVGL